jgi:hypothetical protein
MRPNATTAVASPTATPTTIGTKVFHTFFIDSISSAPIRVCRSARTTMLQTSSIFGKKALVALVRRRESRGAWLYTICAIIVVLYALSVLYGIVPSFVGFHGSRVVAITPPRGLAGAGIASDPVGLVPARHRIHGRCRSAHLLGNRRAIARSVASDAGGGSDRDLYRPRLALSHASV